MVVEIVKFYYGNPMTREGVEQAFVREIFAMFVTVGFCEGADEGGVLRSVYYDTTGEFALPLFQRTSEWKTAMSQIEHEELLQYRAWPMSGNFYRMGIPLEMLKGG